MFLTPLYCFIVAAANITFLQVDRDSEFHAHAGCSPLMTTNSQRCDRDLNATSLRVDGRLKPLVMKNYIDVHYLKQLEAFCYPSVHMWCWIRSTNIEIPELCDGFLLAAFVETTSVFDQLSTNSLTAFSSRESFQSCNSKAILEPNAIHESVRGMTLKFVGLEMAVYTGKSQLASELSRGRTGFVQGIELTLIEVLRQKLNFSLARAASNIYLHFKFNSLEDETDWLKESSIGYVLKLFSYSAISACGLHVSD